MRAVDGLVRSGRRRPDQVAVLAIAAAAALLAALGPAAPTGLRLWDGVLVMTLTGLAVHAAAHGPSWATVAAAVPAAAGIGAAGLSIWALAGWGSLLVALAATAVSSHGRLLRAVALALAVQALLRMPAFGPFGLPSLMAATGFLAVFVGFYVEAGRTARRRVRGGITVVVAAAAVVAVLGGLSVLSARAEIDRGVGSARRGLAAARSGDTALVADELDRAAEALQQADARTTSVPARLLRLLPIASQHQQALAVATSEGAAISAEAAAAAREVDLESIRLVAGSVDLGAIERVAPRLAAVTAALDRGRTEIEAVRSGWLVPQVRSRLDGLLEEVDELLPTAELASEAMGVMPGLLGGKGRRSYFVILGTPAESREFGGFLGSWVLLDIVDGDVAVADSGRIRELYNVSRATTLPNGLAPAWFYEMARPTEWPQNLPSTPDFRTIADVGRVLFADAFDRPIDGFLYVDPWAVIELLRLTGPVSSPELEIELSADNAEQFFFQDQYGAGNRNDLFDGLAAVGEVVLLTLPERTLPGPEDLVDTLGPVVRAGRLQMVTFDDVENAFLERVRLLHPFGPGDDPDFVGVIQTNGTPSKLDLYLNRSVAYDVNVASDGSLTGTVRVDLRTSIPPDTPSVVTDLTLGLDQYEGINRVLLSLYTPHALTGVRLNGVSDVVQAAEEFGLQRYLIEAPVPPTGETVTVEFDVIGMVDPADPYAVTVWHQPLVNNDAVRVSYRDPFDAFVWEQALTETTSVAAPSASGD